MPQENLSEPTPTAQPVDDASNGDEIEPGVQQMRTFPGNSSGQQVPDYGHMQTLLLYPYIHMEGWRAK